MKCIKNMESDLITRVSDTLADQRVRSSKFTYCSKEQWKKQESKGKFAKKEVLDGK